MQIHRKFLLLILFASFFGSTAWAEPTSVQTTWRLLDYIAVDYRGAVANGEVISPGEFAEMAEFADSAKERIEQLPSSEAKPELLLGVDELRDAIAAKAAPDVVAVTARTLAAELIRVYPVPLAPSKAPDFARGEMLYKTNCASCHGMTGDGAGPASAGLDPPAIAFQDKERAQERSVFGLYQVIEQGLDGTSMASFAHLPAEDRWALAFYVGTFAYPESDSAEGERVWETESDLRSSFDMKKLVGITPATLAEELGNPPSDQLVAYLRRHPEALSQTPEGSLNLARTRLKEMMGAYESGQREAAGDLALSAYLDGFEPVEAVLATRNRKLLAEVEKAMGSLRAGVADGLPSDEIQSRAQSVDALFAQAEAVMSEDSGSAGSSFFGALAILLREGLEALLIVVAMLTFLRRAERQDVLPYVHAGWITAILAGILTWGVANYFITISGATRELTEGLGSLIAALILLWVGVWMHGKSNADVWQRYIREKLSQALTGRSAWFLFGLSFIVVYREVFETILFCVALWNQGNAGALLAGALVAVLALAGIAFAMIRCSKVLPIRQFFAYSSALIAVLAVVLTGKGVSAMQEAGFFPITPLGGLPRIEMLGMFPTMEGAAAQMVMLLLLAVGFGYNQRSAKVSSKT